MAWVRCGGNRRRLGGCWGPAWGAAALLAISGLAVGAPVYPPAPEDAVVDTLHGVAVADPYRWLEDGNDGRVRSWISAESAVTHAFLDTFPERGVVHDRLQELLAIGTLSAPVGRGGRWFFEKKEGSQNQPVLYVREGADGFVRSLVDPNALNAAGTTSLDWWYPSRDGRRVAYGLSEGGSELSTLHVCDVSTGRDLPDVIPNTRACSLEWTPDGAGFYYTRFPSAASGEEEARYRRCVYYHGLGSDPTSDPLLFGHDLDLTDWTDIRLSGNGRYLLATVYKSSARTDLYLNDLTRGQGFVPIIRGEQALFLAEIAGDTLVVVTDWKAPRRRVLRAPVADPAPERWREIIPEGENVLESVALAGGRLLVESLHDAASSLNLYDLDGRPVGQVALPEIGSVSGIDGAWDAPEASFAFQSFLVPPIAYRLDVAQGTIEEFDHVTAAVNPLAYLIEHVWFRSKDRTPVPMFIIHKTGQVRAGLSPTIVTGYGGFDVNMTPAFLRSCFLWLESGGVYVIANLRGGGEFGEDWHRAGMLEQKQHSFDDFIGAAEWLVVQGYTNPMRLGIWGGSNGGLLVGAAITQRPDLFRAAVCDVPLLDMVRYERFGIAKLWSGEYGSASDPEQFLSLLAYSPYHRVEDGTAYPAVLFTSAESDARVDPLHARKMAARLQHASASGLPVLLRQEPEAGHGQGKPTSKLLEELTDSWSFMFQELGVAPPER